MDTVSVHLEQQSHIETAINKIKHLSIINRQIVFCRGMASVHVQIINTPVLEIIDITRPGALVLLNMIYARCLSYTPATVAMQAAEDNAELKVAQDKQQAMAQHKEHSDAKDKRDQEDEDNFAEAVELAIEQRKKH
jgi:hypothetical protein